MGMVDLLQSQLLDPFRIGLIVALLYTAIRNQAVSGLVLPLAAGVVFLAVILPSTMGLGAAVDLGLWTVIGVGILANSILLAIALAGWLVIQRSQR